MKHFPFEKDTVRIALYTNKPFETQTGESEMDNPTEVADRILTDIDLLVRMAHELTIDDICLWIQDQRMNGGLSAENAGRISQALWQ